MPQTMLLLFAIMLGGQLMLVWQRDGLESQQNLIRIELESQARGVGSEVFEILASRPFDRNTVILSPGDFTPESEFGVGRAFPAEIVDLDDVHEMETYFAERTVSDTDGNLQTLTYSVTAEVDYVTDENGISLIETGGAQTYYKMVTLTISNPDLARLLSSDHGIRVSRVYSYRQ